MKIAVFGGTFNPPHFSHFFLIQHLLESGLVDHVLLVPTYKHPFKSNIEESYESRTKMLGNLSILIAHTYLPDNIEILTTDRDLPEDQQGKMFYQLREIQKRFPNDELFLVIGSDILDETDKWYNWDKITNFWNVIVYGREGYDGKITVPITLPNISSSEIRKKLRLGEDVSMFVPNEIFYDINVDVLYRET